MKELESFVTNVIQSLNARTNANHRSALLLQGLRIQLDHTLRTYRARQRESEELTGYGESCL